MARQKNERIHHWQIWPTGNTRGSQSDLNDRTLNSNSNSYEQIKNTSNGNFIGKYKIQSKYIFLL